MMFITDDKGNYLPIAVTYDATRNILIGSITKKNCNNLLVLTQSAHAKQLQPHFSLGGFVFGVFTSIIARVVSTADVSKFYRYDTSISDWGGVDNNPSVTGKGLRSLYMAFLIATQI